jgi:3-dehydroquinate dehydratase-2
LLNGVNLNTLGTREVNTYGNKNLGDIVSKVESIINQQNLTFEHLQSNTESELITRIHNNNYKIIIFNPAAWTHSSIALRDALLSVDAKFIEVHISNIYQREEFRHKSYFSDIALGVIAGCGDYGYELAANYATNYLQEN